MKRSLVAVLLLSCAPGCAYRWIERRVDALEQVVDEATRAGAATCAPVELALSRVHLEFARGELREGDAPRAERHLILAEPNGQAALRLAKEQKCAIKARSPGLSSWTSGSRADLRASSFGSRAEPRASSSGSRAEPRASTSLRSNPLIAAHRGRDARNTLGSTN